MRSVTRGIIEPQTITVETLLTALRTTKVLRGDASGELMAHLHRLAPLLDGDQFAALVSQSFERGNVIIGEARKGVDKLLPLFSAIAQQLKAALEAAERSNDPSGDVLLEWIVELIDVATRLGKLLDGPLRIGEFPITGRARRFWTDMWLERREDLIEVVRLATGHDPGLHRQQGPLVRFLTVIIPLVTGEKPTPRTIVSWITDASGYKKSVTHRG